MSTSSSNVEREIKFSPTREVQARLAAKREPAEIVEVLRAAFGLGDYTFGSEQLVHIEDIYFDTKDLNLYRSRITLRIRNENGKREVTLKRFRSHTPGEFDRKEINFSISEAEQEQYLLNGIEKLLVSEAPDLAELSYSPVVKLINERRKYRIVRGEEKLDLCLDRFSTSRYGKPTNRNSCFEIEIEARSNAGLAKLGKIKNSVRSMVPTLGLEDKTKYEQSVDELGLVRAGWKRSALDLYHAPNFGTWLGVVVSALGVLAALVIFAIQSMQPTNKPIDPSGDSAVSTKQD